MLAAAAARDLPGVADIDLQFHDTLLELSGYQGLHRIWRSMDGLVRARTYATLALPGREELIEYTAGSHRPIVDAIRTGDPDIVDAAVKHHIHEVPSLMAGRLPASAS
jgi:DNA-binding FadR family transcriptional regulator